MLAKLSALPGRFELNVRRASATASQAAQHAYGVTSRALKRAILVVLGSVEAVLLSPAGRERVHASATFALIFLFAVTSVDFLLSGGPEFGAPARAAQPQRVLHAVVQAAPTEVAAAAEQSAPAPAPTALSSAMMETRGANIIAVSQTFQAQAEQRPLAQAPAATSASIVEASQPSDLLAGETADAADATAPAAPAQPRKEVRVKAPQAAAATDAGAL